MKHILFFENYKTEPAISTFLENVLNLIKDSIPMGNFNIIDNQVVEQHFSNIFHLLECNKVGLKIEIKISHLLAPSEDDKLNFRNFLVSEIDKLSEESGLCDDYKKKISNMSVWDDFGEKKSNWALIYTLTFENFSELIDVIGLGIDAIKYNL